MTLSTHNAITPQLTKLIQLARRPEPILRAMGTTFKSITEGAFNSVGASYRPSSWPPKKDGRPSILQKSTTMAKSFQLTVNSQEARLTNPMIYAQIHQFGGTIKPKNKAFLSWVGSDGKRYFARSVKIPARPFFPVAPDGKLTPKAEQKIAAAAQRALDREAQSY